MKRLLPITRAICHCQVPLFSFLFLLIFVVAALSACSSTTGEPDRTTPAVTATLAANATATASPAPLPGTPFLLDTALRIPTIATTVGTGAVSFAAMDDASTLKTTIDGMAPVIEGLTCLWCLPTVEIGPELHVPVSLFTACALDDLPGTTLGPSHIVAVRDPDDLETVTSIEASDLQLSVPIPEDEAQFILTGRKGAVLAKVGNGFRLESGTAYLVDAAALPAPTAAATAVATATAPLAAPTKQPTAAPTEERSVTAHLLAADNPQGGKKIEVLLGPYNLTSGTELWTGSSLLSIAEEMLTFPRGLLIDVGPGGLTLQGTTYPEGAQLYVGPAGLTDISEE